MSNHNYDDYYDDKRFLQYADQYSQDYDNNRDLRNAIADEVHSLLYNSHGDSNDVSRDCSEAISLIRIYTFIVERREAEQDE